MPIPTVTITTGHTCARCGDVFPAIESNDRHRHGGTAFANDYPTGVYLTIRRVTEDHNHYLTDELFTCSKECAVEVVQYGIHGNAVPFRPVGRVTR